MKLKIALFLAALFATVSIPTPHNAHAWTEFRLSFDQDVMAFDGENLYLRTEARNRQSLRRYSITSGLESNVYSGSPARTSIPLVAALDGDIVFVEEDLPSRTRNESISTVNLLRATDTKPRVIKRATMRTESVGRRHTICGDEISSVSFLSSTRIQTMTTRVGRVRSGRCAIRNFWRANRTQRQRIEWITDDGAALRSRSVRIGEDLTQHGGVFDFSPGGNRLVYPKRTHFVGVRLSDMKSRKVAVRDARRIDAVFAMDNGSAFVDVILNKRVNGHLRQLRYFPNYLTGDRSTVVANLWRLGPQSVDCQNSVVAHNSPPDELTSFAENGEPTVLPAIAGIRVYTEFQCAGGRIVQDTADNRSWMPIGAPQP